jgi:hypothetical protein
VLEDVSRILPVVPESGNYYLFVIILVENTEIFYLNNTGFIKIADPPNLRE